MIQYVLIVIGFIIVLTVISSMIYFVYYKHKINKSFMMQKKVRLASPFKVTHIFMAIFTVLGFAALSIDNYVIHFLPNFLTSYHMNDYSLYQRDKIDSSDYMSLYMEYIDNKQAIPGYKIETYKKDGFEVLFYIENKAVSDDVISFFIVADYYGEDFDYSYIDIYFDEDQISFSNLELIDSNESFIIRGYVNNNTSMFLVYAVYSSTDDNNGVLINSITVPIVTGNK